MIMRFFSFKLMPTKSTFRFCSILLLISFIAVTISCHPPQENLNQGKKAMLFIVFDDC